jgi:hypothetical protein
MVMDDQENKRKLEGLEDLAENSKKLPNARVRELYIFCVVAVKIRVCLDRMKLKYDLLIIT